MPLTCDVVYIFSARLNKQRDGEEAYMSVCQSTAIIAKCGKSLARRQWNESTTGVSRGLGI